MSKLWAELQCEWDAILIKSIPLGFCGAEAETGIPAGARIIDDHKS